jgi:hypothetical protein
VFVQRHTKHTPLPERSGEEEEGEGLELGLLEESVYVSRQG